jgi:hypothetical protein
MKCRAGTGILIEGFYAQKKPVVGKIYMPHLPFQPILCFSAKTLPTKAPGNRFRRVLEPLGQSDISFDPFDSCRRGGGIKAWTPEF